MRICGGWRQLLRATSALLAIACIGAPIASASDHDKGPKRQPAQCTGTLAAVMVVGDLVVPTGSSCQLVGTKVLGSVIVQPSATLTATANAIVAADVTCGAGSSCSLASTLVGDDLYCDGASCALDQAKVVDNVVVTNGTFAATTSSTVGHDLSCSGQSCTLDTSKVGDDVSVRAGVLDTQLATIGDDVDCGAAVCTLNDTTVGDDVALLRGTGELYLNGSHLENLRCDGARCNVDTEIGNDLVPSVIERDVRTGEGTYFSARLAQIGDDVSCSRCVAIDLFDSTVGGDVESSAQTQGGLFCNNTISGSLSFAFNTQYFITCGGNVIGGSLVLLHNAGVLSVIGNTVRQSLVLIQNDATEIDVFTNAAGKSIQCVHNRPQPIGAGNTAPRIDRDCGPIGAPLPA
jgi:hypothetical protein